ncbi:hypothetical protein OH76DRAFT_255804 [Lentinus brumalis]|uniref:Uncharacterized protein n=1 Tax=Lentinus brumalis TaxID=2498619 RepID=A0A371CL73_9APHY|nr:hypothetical protein OH76DRAFT_255804 [Polyporus brumalis]
MRRGHRSKRPVRRVPLGLNLAGCGPGEVEKTTSACRDGTDELSGAGRTNQSWRKTRRARASSHVLGPAPAIARDGASRKDSADVPEIWVAGVSGKPGRMLARHCVEGRRRCSGSPYSGKVGSRVCWDVGQRHSALALEAGLRRGESC